MDEQSGRQLPSAREYRNWERVVDGVRANFFGAMRNPADVGVLLQQMRRKAVTKRVRRYPLVDLGYAGRGMAGAPELASRHRVDRVNTGKQPPLWACRLVPGPQQLEQMRRQHHLSQIGG
jgi:hypothetical protein